MLGSPWWFLLLVTFIKTVACLQDEDEVVGDPGLSVFRSRPDLTPTKWEIQTHYEDRLAPGYWFSAPYHILNQKTFGKDWVGCHIYDNKGELVWSSAHLFSQGNVEDFRVSNVNGETLLTLMDQGREEAIILDQHYEVREVIRIQNINTHEFHFVENGTKALIVRSNPSLATREMGAAIGYYGSRPCHIGADKLVELDAMAEWEVSFEWDPYSYIGLDESTYDENSPQKRCGEGGWDYIHANSIDKDKDGNYYYSARHTDTIYKISKDDGSIIWRLSGRRSDFPKTREWAFSRQHNVRVRGKNDTHVILSLLDNAKGVDHARPPSYEFSRGLLLAVNERDMTVSTISQFDHPYAEDPQDMYSPRRGNYQLLPNGNVWMGWSEMGYQSEHDADGTLLQEAKFAVRWLGTYRQYKFPWVGLPKAPPDVFAEMTEESTNGRAVMEVYVSWNGDTEVRSWQLYRTDANNERKKFLTSAPRSGFETKLSYNGYAGHIYVQGHDSAGKVLGTSKTFKVLDINGTGVEDDWHDFIPGLSSVADHPLASFFFGFFCTVAVLMVGWYARRKGYFRSIKSTRYQRLFHSKENALYRDSAEEYDEQALPLQDSRKESLDEGS